jgi:hypothetical protein
LTVYDTNPQPGTLNRQRTVPAETPGERIRIIWFWAEAEAATAAVTVAAVTVAAATVAAANRDASKITKPPEQPR